MGRLFQLAQTLWQRAQWSAPTSVYRILFPRLYALEEVVLPLVQPNLPVSQLRGQGKGCPLTVTCIGLDYGRWHLKRTLYAQEPDEISLPPVSASHLKEAVNSLSGDIVVVACSEQLIHKLPRNSALVLPLYLEHTLNVQGDWEQIEKRLLKNHSAYKDFRLMQKYGYTAEPSRDNRDVEMYYYAMHVPTMQERHGDAAVIVPLAETREHFKRGTLLLIKRQGQIVAGVLCRARGDRVTAISLGIANSDKQLMKEGVQGSLYWLLIRWANQAGYKILDVLGCPPFLDMGIFQFKRKWGTRGGLPPNLHKRMWIQFRQDNPAVRQFLKDSPCAVLDDNGNLYGLVFIDDSMSVTTELEERLRRRYLTPGMKSLCVLSVDDFIKGIHGSPSAEKAKTLENDSPVPSNIQLA